MTQSELTALVESLSVDEKISLCSGKNAWETRDIEHKGIRSIWLADGPHGLRKEIKDKEHVEANGGPSVRATCFPTAVTLAGSWSDELTQKVGAAIAEECAANGVSVILGPGTNIKRSPLCGRNFEYFSEDPLLAGKLAAGMIRGAENKGVGTSLKHFAANNQEHLRMSVSAEIDERALHEIYLKPFEIAVKEGKPSTVMCSYNKINGIYASENKELLTGILREKWGFDGLVMSDWGAVNDRARGIDAGLDLEMPSSSGACDAAVKAAIASGTLSMEALDTAVKNVLTLAQKCASKPPIPCDMPAHHALAVKAMCQSAVLLKNEADILPLDKADNIAVIGALCGANGRYQGGGSSIINPANRVDFLAAIANFEEKIPYAAGYALDDAKPNAELEIEALALAQKHQKVILFVGLTDSFEMEGYDRTHMRLPENQLALIAKMAKVNQHVTVVLIAGSPVEIPWLGGVKALLYVALGGEGMGEGVRALLFGEASPSGKLAETWPLTLGDSPCAAHFPMGPKVVTYNESIFVGYRYYDTAERPVRFPFGFGLSYTKFAYRDFALSRTVIHKGEAIVASVKVKNIGGVVGDEIVQLYLSREKSAAYQAKRELCGFARVSLAPDEEKTVEIAVPYDSLAFCHATEHRFVVENSAIAFAVGTGSRADFLMQKAQVEGEDVCLPRAFSNESDFGTLRGNGFSDTNFYAVHTRKAQDNTPAKQGEYDGCTTLGEMHDSRSARFIMRLALWVTRREIHFSHEAATNCLAAEKAVHYTPLKNARLMTGGMIGAKAYRELIYICNRRGRWAKLLWYLLRKA